MPGARGTRAQARPYVDTLHVELIRAALARNEYVVDGRRIAERILRMDELFEGRPAGTENRERAGS